MLSATVSDSEVFGCELELLDLREQQPLSEAFRTVLLQRPQLQLAVRLCMVQGHSIWHFQTDDKEGNPKAVRVPANPRGEIADRAFYAAPSIRHVEVATGIQHTGIAAWQSCQQSQIVKLPTSVVSLAEGTFMGCYVLRQVAAPGCVHCGQRVFAECCSLGSVGVSDIGDRAFCGCEQLQRFTLLDWRDVEQWVQAEHNAFYVRQI